MPLTNSPSSELFASVSSETWTVSQASASDSASGCSCWSEMFPSEDSWPLDSVPVEKAKSASSPVGLS